MKKNAWQKKTLVEDRGCHKNQGKKLDEGEEKMEIILSNHRGGSFTENPLQEGAAKGTAGGAWS